MRLCIAVLSLFLSLFSASYSQSNSLQKALINIEDGYVKYGIEAIASNAKQSDAWAQFFYARCLEKGYEGLIEQDVVAAFKLYRTVAEKGLPVAQKCVSDCYRFGIGTIVNLNKADMWARKCSGKYEEYELVYIYALIEKGLTHPENITLIPISANQNRNGEVSNLVQNNGLINSNNQQVNNITIIQAPTSSPLAPVSETPAQVQSDVDQDIPTSDVSNENTFALIIANEHYQDVASVPNAIHDGEIFAEYCKKTLGLPASNVTFVKDATYNNIKREIGRLSQIAEVYNGAAQIVFYYAGHGMPNEATKDAFLLPVDGYGSDASTGYSLKELYAALGNMPAQQVVVLLDACFSGSQRGEGMLASARGVAIKAKPNKVEGKLVVLSAAQGDETAYPYNDQVHGLFTYYLLKKLKETNGTIQLGELADYIKENVSKKSIVMNGKLQTPTVSPSSELGESWKNWKLK